MRGKVSYWATLRLEQRKKKEKGKKKKEDTRPTLDHTIHTRACPIGEKEGKSRTLGSREDLEGGKKKRGGMCEISFDFATLRH